MTNDRSYFIFGIFILAILIFNFPFLGIFGKGKALAGIPLLYWFFFIAWLLVIVGIALVTTVHRRKI
ncbi:MAG: hypothetical protein R2769_03640 [Saprospiraceae bacterium]